MNIFSTRTACLSGATIKATCSRSTHEGKPTMKSNRNSRPMNANIPPILSLILVLGSAGLFVPSTPAQDLAENFTVQDFPAEINRDFSPMTAQTSG